MIPGLQDNKIGELTPVTKSYDIAGKKVTFESGKIALFADGSVTIQDEDGHYLLTTCGIEKHPALDKPFFPLSVDYQERFYATGRLAGGRFNKREGRPSTAAVLASRLIDRPIRPMFPKGVVNSVQIIPTIMSATGKTDFSFWGITGASLSIQLAGVHEFEAAVSGARIALTTEGEWIFDPTFEQISAARCELLVAGTATEITMVEFQGDQVPEEDVVGGFKRAQEILAELSAAQADFIATYQKSYEITSIDLTKGVEKTDLEEKVMAHVTESMVDGLYEIGKIEFHDALQAMAADIGDKIGYVEGESDFTLGEVEHVIYSYVKKIMRKRILTDKRRLDGRGPEDVRPVSCEVGYLPRTHGSALFQRGATSALSVVTLAGPDDKELVDGMYPEYERRYMHHYNFPPYSVGDVRPMRGVGRREIGHGNLGEKALEPVLPSEADFAYTIRVVSEIHTCNGSSSMASVCGSTMALMDAGVPIKAPVTGVAMGMIFDEDSGQYVILSDIQAQEDFLGDLDFKVAGTEAGITALQMDTKIKGFGLDVVRSVFAQAKQARGYILQNMTKHLSAPRPDLSPFAPALISFMIDPEDIGTVIGKGGETIQGMQKDHAVTISIEDDGLVTITGESKERGEQVKAIIIAMLKDVEVGDEYDGKVAKILDGVGAIVEFGVKQSGMVHISKLADRRVEKVEDIVNK